MRNRVYASKCTRKSKISDEEDVLNMIRCFDGQIAYIDPLLSNKSDDKSQHMKFNQRDFL